MKKTKHPQIIAIFIAYNAEKTLKDFYENFPKRLVDKIILVDDCSRDKTYKLAKKLGITSYRNPINLGYGGNMKKALALGLKSGGDIFIDIHPDGEYKPDSIPLMLEEIKNGAELVLGDRFTNLDTPLKNGMFLWKLIPLRVLNLIDNFILGTNIHDFHQGFRGYTKAMLKKINFEANSNNYLFSFELIAQSISKKIKIAQVPVNTLYEGKKRGASLKNSIKYSIGTFKILGLFIFAKVGIQSRIFLSPTKPLDKRINFILSKDA